MKKSILFLTIWFVLGGLFAQSAREVGVELRANLTSDDYLQITCLNQGVSTRYQVYTKGRKQNRNLKPIARNIHIAGNRSEFRPIDDLAYCEVIFTEHLLFTYGETTLGYEEIYRIFYFFSVHQPQRKCAKTGSTCSVV